MRSLGRILAVALALCAASPAAEAAHLTERVAFESLETFPGASAIEPGVVTGLLTLPDAPGPHPAVVMPHGCAGLLNKHARWAELFADWGFASLRVDSFAPRGLGEICTDIRKPVPRAADLNGALVYLRSRGEVDASGVVVIGWSHGAGVAPRAAAEPGSIRDDLKLRVAGVVAVYPYCSRDSQPFRAPVPVPIGDADRWTPWGLCESMVENLSGRGEPVDLVVYPGATHSYDCMACNGVYHGYELKFDEDAYEDSVARIRAYLVSTLAGD